VADVDSLDEQPDAVTLITLHQAKGLEFPVVFIVGLEEGIFPHIRSFDDPAQMEEERRLAYVGVTRAKERLYLMRAFRRNAFGSRTPNPPSRFLRDIPQHLLDAKISQPSLPTWDRGTRAAGPAPSRIPANAPRVPEGPRGYSGASAGFRTGEHVRHKQFGEGIVVSCEAARDDQVVTVAFKGGVGIKRLALSMAPLEKV
jgi:DNA helicase-2/ATP-dependent DNA helicase PcrA